MKTTDSYLALFDHVHPMDCNHCGQVHHGVSVISDQRAITSARKQIKECGELREQCGFSDVRPCEVTV